MRRKTACGLYTGTVFTSQKKTASGHYIGTVFPSQGKLTENYPKVIRKIDGSRLLARKQQQKAVMLLPGITRAGMDSIIKSTGPELASSIRKLI